MLDGEEGIVQETTPSWFIQARLSVDAFTEKTIFVYPFRLTVMADVSLYPKSMSSTRGSLVVLFGKHIHSDFPDT